MKVQNLRDMETRALCASRWRQRLETCACELRDARSWERGQGQVASEPPEGTSLKDWISKLGPPEWTECMCAFQSTLFVSEALENYYNFQNGP